MKRTQVQFDEETYAALKRAAYERQTLFRPCFAISFAKTSWRNRSGS